MEKHAKPGAIKSAVVKAIDPVCGMTADLLAAKSEQQPVNNLPAA